MGGASQVVLAGIDGRFTYLLYPRLIGEITDVLARAKIARLVDEASARRFVTDIVATGQEVDHPVDVQPVNRDPDDDYLIGLATAHEVELLVTGESAPSNEGRSIRVSGRRGGVWCDFGHYPISV